MIWKSEHWSLHNALISKSGQIAENQEYGFFQIIFETYYL